MDKPNPFILMRGAGRAITDLAGDAIKASLSPGQKLLAHRPDGYHCAVILVKKADGEYVTWVHNFTTGGHGWGHYFADRGKAVTDFNER